MVSISPEMIAKFKDVAKTAFNKMSENPQEGSIFDAFSKLGINNTEDLKAGVELFKEDPKAAASSALQTLGEKGFGTSQATQSVASQNTSNNQGSALSQIFEKLGINNEEDLQAGIDLFKEDPKAAAETMAATLGGNPEIAGKLGSVLGKFLA